MTTAKADTLAPSYNVPIAIMLLSIPLLWVQLSVGLLVAVLGLFLLYQTSTIRLVFTASTLEVRRNDNLLKTFPYADWQTWKIFWPPVPILFYFKEVNSIHFLPVLFSPEELRIQLEKHCAECKV